MPPPAAAVQPFGKYELVERIAAGGMAEIYRANFRVAAGITKQVVIKKILPHYAGNASFVRMFMDEAKIVVGLSHGNIAQVFDFGELDGEYYLAMEFVPGQALSKILRRAREQQLPVLPTPFALLIAMEMCKGLQYAHTRLGEDGRPLGLVHRDVSPQNVIVSYDGQVKLVDFGIAKARTAGRTETEAGAIKGKYVYFSPEQARTKEIDARTDVFATGIVLYEMLCGRLPFEGKMLDVLRRIIACDFPRPRQVNPDLSPALERIILTAMAAEKADRYQSALALHEALAGYLYASAPTFSTASLAHLMGFLYEPELVAAGTPVQLPREFSEQLPLWRKALPERVPQKGERPERLERPTSAARTPRRSQPPAAEVPTRTADGESTLPSDLHTAERLRQAAGEGAARSRWLLAAVPLLAAALAAAVVVIAGRFGTYSVQLTSLPPGATVEVDGQLAPGATPLLISGLSASEPHQLRVSAPGMQPWTRQVEPARAETIPVHAALAPLEPPKPAPPPQPPRSARHPAGSVEVHGRHHALKVAPTSAARLRLDPAKTYALWAEGPGAFFFLEGDRRLPADEAFGAIPSGEEAARAVRGARALYLFFLDEPRHDPGAGLGVRVEPEGGRATTTLRLDGRLHAIWPQEQDRFTLDGLSPDESYELVVRRGRDGRPAPLAYVQRPRGSLAQVLQVGGRQRISGAAQLAFFFVDDVPEENDGSVVVELQQAGPPR